MCGSVLVRFRGTNSCFHRIRTSSECRSFLNRSWLLLAHLIEVCNVLQYVRDCGRMGNTATCPSDMCGANKEFENFNIPNRPGLNPVQKAHEVRKVQTFHRYAEDGDVKVRLTQSDGGCLLFWRV
jgi:hypothetical protein